MKYGFGAEVGCFNKAVGWRIYLKKMQTHFLSIGDCCGTGRLKLYFLADAHWNYEVRVAFTTFVHILDPKNSDLADGTEDYCNLNVHQTEYQKHRNDIEDQGTDDTFKEGMYSQKNQRNETQRHQA